MCIVYTTKKITWIFISTWSAFFCTVSECVCVCVFDVLAVVPFRWVALTLFYTNKLSREAIIEEREVKIFQSSHVHSLWAHNFCFGVVSACQMYTIVALSPNCIPFMVNTCFVHRSFNAWTLICPLFLALHVHAQ